MKWYFKCWQQYADFAGRARRKEFWIFYLFNFIFFAITIILGDMFMAGFVPFIYILSALIPSLAVSIRRLHDIGKSGCMYLVVLIPIIGSIWLFILSCIDSQPGKNK